MLILEALKQDGFMLATVEDWMKMNTNSREFYTHNYFAIIWNQNGNMVGLIENERQEAKPNQLLFVSPNKTMELEKLTGRAWVFLFTSKFYEKCAQDAHLLHSELFFSTELNAFITDPKASEHEFQKLIIDRLKYFEDKSKTLYMVAAHNCIEIMLLDALKEFDISSDNQQPIYNSELEVVNKFRMLLQKYYKTEKTVAFYADKLHITSKYLIKCTNAILKKTPKQLIIEKLVQESKRMLRYSSASIAEIGWDLGFNDESNFSTFFKKHAKVNPSDYQNLISKR